MSRIVPDTSLPPLRLAIAGIGTVGRQVLERLQQEATLLEARGGRKLRVVAVAVRSLETLSGVGMDGIRTETDALALAHAADVDVVVELIGGSEGAARALVEATLDSGKHVVTANKALIAKHGLALAQRAEANRVCLLFEAAVAGAIPVISVLREGLAANRVGRVAGILNGTCNFLLTRMAQARIGFDTALSQAQALGYAEADPAADIDGHDTAQKLAILAGLAFGAVPDVDAIPCTGIRAVTLADIDAAAELGYAIKLLGIAALREDQGIEAAVAPCLVPFANPLAQVGGALNAITLGADAAGDIVLQGRGAGGLPTASAVIGDVLLLARGGTTAYFPMHTDSRMLSAWKPCVTTHPTRYFLRLEVRDAAGALAEITRILADEGVSVAQMRQQLLPESRARIGIFLHPAAPACVAGAVARLAALSVSVTPPLALRVEEGDAPSAAPMVDPVA